MTLQPLQWRVAAHSDFALNDLTETRLFHRRLQHFGVVDELVTPRPEEVVDHTRSFRKGRLWKVELLDCPSQVGLVAVKVLDQRQDVKQIRSRGANDAARF